MKSTITIAALSLAASLSCSGVVQAKEPQVGQLKYVFYFISDGTGINTVLGTEQMLAELQGRWGRDTLCMTNFPVVSVASTYSFNSGITDSAASGTCLATGTKTYNGAIGVGPDTTNVYSAAYYAHQAGVPVGIASSVCVNHATPASQFAHVKHRSLYYDIANQLSETGFDFFGGSDITLERPKNTIENRTEIYQKYDKAGYTLVRSYDAYEANADRADKMILFQDLDRSLYIDDNSLPYAIDAQPGQLSVYDVLKAQIDFLYRKSQKLGNKGFFLMNEIGGKVDYACHAQDGATAFREVCLVDSCVKLAYDFYLQHPDETLIILTADHETGGLTLGVNSGGYEANFGVLANQKCSVDALTRAMQQLRKETHNKVAWEQLVTLLKDKMGFWGNLKLTADEEQKLKDVYAKSFEGQMENEKNLYSANEPMAVLAVRIMNEKAHLGWTTGGHTAGLVPVYACGVGAELFSHHNDNGDFAPAIIRLAGYKK